MINGFWHAKWSAARVPASFTVTGDDYIITLDSETLTGQISTLKVSDRLGNVERKIELLDGSLFSTLNNDAVDGIFGKSQKTNSIIHHLETNLKWVLLAFIVTIVAGFSFFKWGVPATSHAIANALPHKTNQMISSGAMDFLDEHFFEESNISKKEQDTIKANFDNKIKILSLTDNKDIKYNLHFRLWKMDGQSIPNALALPSGDIVLTDKFVELSSSPDEINAVLLHEMGHVVHRHGLETLVQSTLISVASIMIIGDASSFADMGIGLGSALVSSSYSRSRESEADSYAFKKMLEAKIDPASFGTIMNKMTKHMQDETNTTQIEQEDDDGLFDYFSSHPGTKDRIEIADKYSKCFKKGLAVCE